MENQEKVRNQIQKEREKKIDDRYEKMINDKSRVTFWKEIKDGNRKPPSSWISVKDKDGKRILDPQKIIERIAQYYEQLFSKQHIENHPYHEEVTTSIEIHKNDTTQDHHDYNKCPTLQEVKEAIRKKKNSKSTTDLPNEIIKGGEEVMSRLIHQVVKTFWNEEKVPDMWNEGLITSVWKGKGDKERMDFQRGITVSSSISMVPEEILHNRMTRIMKLSPSQGGGKKGTSTRDHVFLLRAIISTAIKEKRDLFITFFDVQKAYDHADPEDMMHVAWNQGLKGKLWRLTRLLNTNLTAKINTRYGKTRKIIREIGGKQGGKTMTYLFAKLMDTLAEEMQETEDIGININNIQIGALEWVDDVVAFAEGLDQQEKVLDFTNEFAVKHKLQWGQDKCQVLKVGGTNYPEKTWKLGEKTISSTSKYKYLGDIISEKGDNKENLEKRKDKLQMTTRRVLACGNIDIMKRIQTKTLLQLHETITISSILINCETWILNKQDQQNLDKMELWAYKKIIGLPITTPTPAVIYEMRTLFTSIRVIARQLKYLHIILCREDSDWCKKSLYQLTEKDIGWGKYMRKILDECQISYTLDEIKTIKKQDWKHIVEEKTWEMNNKKLLEACKGKEKMRTKTLSISQKLNTESYDINNKENVLFTLPRCTTKTIIMARYGMLDCRKNFSYGYGNKVCPTCMTIDDERHRINDCIRWSDINLHRSSLKIDFEVIFSNDPEILKCISSIIQSIWNLENGKNEMRSRL